MFQKYGRIKKRSFVVAGICLLIVLIPLLFLAIFSQKEVSSGNIADFSFGEILSEKTVHGLGLNILDSNSQNIILDNSFEPFVYRQNLTINNGDSKTIKVAMANDFDSGVYKDDFFIGAKANVLRIDPQGNRQLKKTGIVTNYISDQIDTFNKISLPPDLPRDLRWNAIAANANQVVVVGDRGYVLTIESFSESTLTKLPTDLPLVGIANINKDFLALDQLGNGYIKSEGKDWRLLFRANTTTLNKKSAYVSDFSKSDQVIDRKIKWHDLSSKQNNDGTYTFMAVAEKGYYVFGNSEGYVLKQLSVPDKISTITANEDGYYLAGENSLAFYTKNGENFRYLDTPQGVDWFTISARGNQVLLAGQQGQVVFSQDGISYTSVNQGIQELSIEYLQRSGEQEDQILLNPSFVSSAILSSDQLLLIDSSGLVLYSDDLGKSWQTSETNNSIEKNPPGSSLKTPAGISKITNVERISTGHLVATTVDGEIYFALMGLNIELDSSLEDGSYENGDILLLEQLKADPVRPSQLISQESFLAEWFVTNKEIAGITLDESAPGGGNGCFKIDLSNLSRQEETNLIGLYSDQRLPFFSKPDTFVMRQKLSNESKKEFNANTFFSYSFYAKTEQNESIDIEISFDEISLDQQLIHKKVSGDWQKYQGVFVMPANSLRKDKDAFLNLTFSGKGKVFIDSLWIGPSKEIFRESGNIFSDLEVNGSLLRIAFNPIGDPSCASENWLKISENISLLYQTEAGFELIEQDNFVNILEYCRGMKMNPWLIIDSEASSAELRHLMQYLFGLENTKFGELRLEQGALGQYGNAFDQIYFEILDSDNTFNNDLQRKSFVDCVISTVAESNEYDRVKNNIYFVDGMLYQDNLFSSHADFHASKLVIDEPFYSVSELTDFSNSFYEIMPRDTSLGIESRSELISSTKLISDRIRLADLMSASLTMLGTEKESALFDIASTSSEKEIQFADAFGKIGEMIYKMNAYQVESAIEQENVMAFAFRDKSNMAMILCNLSLETTSCQISEPGFENLSQLIYDDQGRLLDELDVSRNDQIISMLPGSVVVIYGEENGK